MKTLILAALLLVMGSAAEANTYYGIWHWSNPPTHINHIEIGGRDYQYGRYPDFTCPSGEGELIGYRTGAYNLLPDSCAGDRFGLIRTDFVVEKRLWDDGYGSGDRFEIIWCPGDPLSSFMLISCD